jgi:hypothetical protein
VKKLVLKFNAHPDSTLRSVVSLANATGANIEGIEDLKKTNRIVIKVVTVRGDAGSLGDFRERLTRMPAVTIKEG